MIRLVLAAAMAVLCCTTLASAQPSAASQREAGLSALIALTNAHLQTVVTTLKVVAALPAVRTGDWAHVRGPLTVAKAASGIAANFSFAAPDGRFWTVGKGLQSASVADRRYFRSAMAGKITVGEPVVSRSSGDKVGVIAIPIEGAGGKVVGLLDTAVYLKELSVQLKSELDIQPGTVFFAIDPTGMIVLHGDTTNIFAKPAEMSATLKTVVAAMLAGDHGSQTYVYRGTKRTTTYRRSALTGWIFGYGTTH